VRLVPRLQQRENNSQRPPPRTGVPHDLVDTLLLRGDELGQDRGRCSSASEARPEVFGLYPVKVTVI
jgi:hypothetical protein